ncbi:MAG: LytR family transcriptional regulator [Armatimonadetes bacterium]|nr:MAG: LytR family transcriptional regulator [Armatimonadota bacterium]
MTVRPTIAALLSAVIPGAGQLYARRPIRAAVFFFPTLAVGGATYVLFDRGTLELAQLLVRPSFLTGLLVVDAVVLVWRIASVIDAASISSSIGDRAVFALPMALILVAVAAPHGLAWIYTTDTIDALDATFVAVSPNFVRASPTEQTKSGQRDLGRRTIDYRRTDPAETTRTVYSHATRLAIFDPEFGEPDAVRIWPDLASKVITQAPYEPPPDPLGADRLTILLVGGDAGPNREGLRTDSMNVVTIDLTSGEVALFGFPRNFKMMPLPKRFQNSFIGLEEVVVEVDLTDADADGWPDTWYDQDGDSIPDEPPFVSCHCFPTMLNKVHQYTQDWTRTYPYSPDPGLSALKEILSNAMDLPIDYFVMVDMAGFVDVIDAIGGVDINVKEAYHVKVSSPEVGKPKAAINVEPGMNHLDGLEALAYTRWRIGSSDYHRMGRQRCLIRAAATQTDTLSLIAAYPTLLDLMRESITTDIPIDALPDLVWAAGQIDLDNVATVGFVPPAYNSGRTPGHYPIPDIGKIRWKTRDVLENGVTAQSSSGASECD